MPSVNVDASLFKLGLTVILLKTQRPGKVKKFSQDHIISEKELQSGLCHSKVPLPNEHNCMVWHPRDTKSIE